MSPKLSSNQLRARRAARSPSSVALRGMELYGGPEGPPPPRPADKAKRLPPPMLALDLSTPRSEAVSGPVSPVSLHSGTSGRSSSLDHATFGHHVRVSNWTPPQEWDSTPFGLSGGSHRRSSDTASSVSPVSAIECPLPPRQVPPPFVFPDNGRRLRAVHPYSTEQQGTLALADPLPAVAPPEGRANPIDPLSLATRARMRKDRDDSPMRLVIQHSAPVTQKGQSLSPMSCSTLVGTPLLMGSLTKISPDSEIYGSSVTPQLPAYNNVTSTGEKNHYQGGRDGALATYMPGPINVSSAPNDGAESMESMNMRFRLLSSSDGVKLDTPPGEVTASSSVYSMAMDQREDAHHDGQCLSLAAFNFQQSDGINQASRLAPKGEGEKPEKNNIARRDDRMVPQPLFSSRRRSSAASFMGRVAHGHPKRVNLQHVMSHRAPGVVRHSGGRRHVMTASKQGRRLRISPPIPLHDLSYAAPRKTEQVEFPEQVRPKEHVPQPSAAMDPVWLATNLEFSEPKSRTQIPQRDPRESSRRSSRLLSRTFNGLNFPLSRFSNRTSSGTNWGLSNRHHGQPSALEAEEASEPRAGKATLSFAKNTVDMAKRGVRLVLQHLPEAGARRKREKRGKEIKEAIRYIAVVDPAKVKYDMNPYGGRI